ncbi:MAG: type II toxin-antitoxin system VapC family toxin [Candidatus Nanohaloarchaeota archaeon QJJ-9]|nr:type II toxin-antitoxin system VapC family toxin [Candidatus Nanohaloarchaeota archaeon QJJ-9]
MIVDTDILVDFLRGKSEANELISSYRTEPVKTTDMNVFELYFGAYKSERTENNLSKLKGLLNRMEVYSSDEDSMEKAARLAAEQEKEGKKVGVKDILIGGIAAVENEPVLTRNKKHFKELDGVELLEL